MTKIDINKKKITKSLSQTNWKAILFFTTFTFLLWIILQFTKTHNVDDEISIAFSDVPVKEILSVQEIQLPINIEQTGFSLFKKQFIDGKIVFPINELQKKDSVYVFQSSLFITQIAKKLKLSTEEFSVTNKEVIIPFDVKATKKVPIHSNIEINYAKSYASYKGVQINRDSVNIAGPTNEIKGIKSIETEELILKYVRKNSSGELPLLKPFTDAVALEFDKVDYAFEVEKFSEQSFNLPIQLKNAPDNYQVELIPNSITIKFQSSLDELENINEEDFQIECNFNSALSEASILVPKLTEKPKKAIRIQLTPNRIEYILRK
ncbi:hypothetical protein [Psychroflexus planctonicus]|uniref:YbbR-like protein n=1 Tax=Psychroflexus planctonicus TaxID=1526575 RepID=A0ABQ1SFJ7_9FLAO|nr:hypothetical protein [Psychroflexus planctonicus]GGE30530.1 hypothetical protein GCM10010832_08730 [Psychroflexus planctonicus]